ncbi:hydrogenase expression protein HypE [Lyngbya confervoides]|uniref:Hydrogenase maturation protease n=1 Tax=Lyngbya confervoides BDU141951 TaxID=1574623 RepID=A0ABD4T0S0_9CYAN|nr:hydrogenase expression protein HypE [Lyngbya confervoides]MCM1982033.1 hydrogenase maturation protease [Lyngbya confervoides BDU141951]
MGIRESLSEEKSPSFLVLGYGRSHHGDEGIGQAIVAQLHDLALEGVITHCDSILHPELAGRLATADQVIFVHACQMGDAAEVRVRSLDACGSETPGSAVPCSGHSCDPCSLLALTQSVYGHSPRAYWVEVPAKDFSLGDSFSRIAQKASQDALQVIEELIQQV